MRNLMIGNPQPSKRNHKPVLDLKDILQKKPFSKRPPKRALERLHFHSMGPFKRSIRAMAFLKKPGLDGKGYPSKISRSVPLFQARRAFENPYDGKMTLEDKGKQLLIFPLALLNGIFAGGVLGGVLSVPQYVRTHGPKPVQKAFQEIETWPEPMKVATKMTISSVTVPVGVTVGAFLGIGVHTFEMLKILTAKTKTAPQ
jgi:hypothetical protein